MKYSLISVFPTETQDSLSDDALLPLKSYKYSSVDKSFISRYILRHYVRAPEQKMGWSELRG